MSYGKVEAVECGLYAHADRFLSTLSAVIPLMTTTWLSFYQKLNRPIIDVHVYDRKIPLIVVRCTNKALVIVTNDLLE